MNPLSFLKLVQPQARFASSLGASTKVLDVGCGDFARIERYVARRRPDVSISGVDRYIDATIYGRLDDATERRHRGRYERFACDIETQPLPFADGSFGGVYFSHVLEHLVGKEQALREIRRVLEPTGVLYVETPGPISKRIRRPAFLPTSLGGTVHYNDDPTHVGDPLSLEQLRVLLDSCGFTVRYAGSVRELGLVGMPLYASMLLAGSVPGPPLKFRSPLFGAGIRNFVGWGIYALAVPC